MARSPLQLRVADQLVQLEMPAHGERMRLDQALPALRAIQDAFAAAAIRKDGQAVTCVKGCSACCRIQPVPVTPVEACALLLLVEQMPEPHRAAVIARFEERVERLREAGLADGFLEGRRATSEEHAKAEARRYLDLALACPFLEDGACSIYETRPFTCREYFVTTPKELCQDPLSSPVRTVPGIPQAVEASRATAEAFMGKAVYAIPLTLALVYAASHRDDLERTYESSQLLNCSIAELLALATRVGI
jgi:Fe-S-cluster containining protein